MEVISTKMINELSLKQEAQKRQAVNYMLDAAGVREYFGDRNPDRTNTPYFNQVLKKRQEEKQEHESKLRMMRSSEDLRMIYEQMSGRQAHGNIVDTKL